MAVMVTLQHDVIASPLGQIEIAAENGVLVSLEFIDARARLHQDLRIRYKDFTFEETPNLLGMRGRLKRYFAGDFTAFDGVAYDGGGTAFQKAVWAHLCTIPAGTTTSYGAMARALGNPNAMRAVGMANGRNPISIIVPCHRVIGSYGTLTGYGGGLDRKRWLLAHEGVVVAAERQAQLFG